MDETSKNWYNINTDRSNKKQENSYIKKRIKITSALFPLLEEEHTITDTDITDIDDFINCLTNHRCFDPIRDKEEFKALILV